MALDITKEQRESFERYLKEHPAKTTDEPACDVFDDNRSNYNHQAACSRLVKLLLDGKIE